MTRAQLANGKSFEVPPGVTLLDAATHAGLALPHSCRTGRCGSCKAKASQPGRRLQGEDCLSPAERAEGWLLTCTDTLDADAALDLDDLAELAGLRTLTLPARVASIERPSPDLLLLKLRLPPQHGLRYLAGQTLDLIGPQQSGPHGPVGLRRAYSMASADPAQGIELHIRRVSGGAMSAFLFEQLQANALLRIQAPRGSFHLGEVAGLRLVWLATGTGIAPFKAMLEALQAAPRARWPASITLLWGNRKPADLYWRPSAADLPLRFIPVCSRSPGWGGAEGHVQDHAPALAQVDRVYACGAPAMIESARAHYAALPPRHLLSDAFLPSS